VYLAATPEMLAGLSEADKRFIDRIVYDGCDMLKVLTELHHMMRVKELGQAESEEFEDDEYSAEPTLPGNKKSRVS
jgi:hypothetical protein